MTDSLFVIEGPAGSGKTTLARKFSELYSAPIVNAPVDLPRPRNYQGTNGEILAILKDLAYNLESLTETDRGHMVLDRFAISSFVYGQLRAEDERNMRHNWEHPPIGVEGRLRRIVASTLSLVSEGLECLGARDIKVKPRNYRWHILLPTLQELQLRRSNATFNDARVYPFIAERELAIYTWVAEYWNRAMASEFGEMMVLH